MGIQPRPSLYAAFGNKEQLFHKRCRAALPNRAHVVLDRGPGGKQTARAVVEAILLTVASGCSATPRPARGCLVVSRAPRARPGGGDGAPVSWPD